MKEQTQRSAQFMKGVQSRLENIIQQQKEVLADNRPLEIAADYLKSKCEK